MSVTGHGAKTGHVRQADDFYVTPGWAVRAILPHLGDLRGQCILEPGCGEGAIIRELPNLSTTTIVGVEIDAERVARAASFGRGRIICDDYLAWAGRQKLGTVGSAFDIAIGNPPFKLAMEFVQATTRIVRTTAMLLRLGFLASQKRSEWLRRNTPSVYVLPKRPSFTGGGTDSADYAWLVWSPAPPTVRILEVE